MSGMMTYRPFGITFEIESTVDRSSIETLHEGITNSPAGSAVLHIACEPRSDHLWVDRLPGRRMRYKLRAYVPEDTTAEELLERIDLELKNIGWSVQR